MYKTLAADFWVSNVTFWGCMTLGICQFHPISSNQWESHMLFYLLLELVTMATPWLQNGPWRCIFPWTSGFFQTSSHAGVPSGKLTWQWKITLLKMYSLLKMGIFHCYVSLPEGTCFRILSWTFTMSATTSCWYHRAQWAHGFSRWTTC